MTKDEFIALIHIEGTHWIWGGHYDRDDIPGKVEVDGHKGRAYRVAWALKHGEPAKGAYIFRECGNKRCVNPAHIRPTKRRSKGHVEDTPPEPEPTEKFRFVSRIPEKWKDFA